MSTMTIRIEDDLEARLAVAAKRAGTSPHAFILDAIEKIVEQSELEADLHRVADERWAKVLETGMTIPWDEAKAYVSGRARGERPRKPAARHLKR